MNTHLHLVASSEGEVSEGGGVGDGVDLHLESLRRRNLAASTIYQRERALTRFERYTGVAPINATTGDIIRFIDRRQRDGTRLAPQSIGAELAHLTGFYRWAVREGWRDDDPTMRVDRPKLPRNLPRPMPEHSLSLAIDEAPDRLRPMLMLAAFAGLRACEVAPLRGDDLWWHSDPPVIFIRQAKGGNQEAVPLAPILEPELRRLAPKGYLFPKRDGTLGPIKAHSVSHMCNAYLHRLGMHDTFHSLRHRFGSQVYRLSGRDLRQTQELMRHRSPVSTAIYTAVDPGEAAGIVAALPAVG